MPHNIVDSARTITAVVRHATDGGFGTVEPSAAAETAWVELLLTGPRSMIGGPDCTPGYYNNEGEQQIRSHLGDPYWPGFYAMEDVLQAWRDTGSLEGLDLR